MGHGILTLCINFDWISRFRSFVFGVHVTEILFIGPEKTHGLLCSST